MTIPKGQLKTDPAMGWNRFKLSVNVRTDLLK
jgi:hypothetical protein